MSDREFENYLAFLSSLLRLDRKQRASIADELRAHLEDRLEELFARGVSHDDAVRQALAEFGDAAGLAGQFVAISRNRKRRWLMRLTTFSVAATLLFAAGLAIFWPGRNAAPGLAEAVAQAPAAAKKVDPFSASGVEPTLQEKLNKRIDFEVVEMPLTDVALMLQEDYGIQVFLSSKKLEEASISPDHPVTKSFKRVRLSTVLELMLKDLELTYVEKDDLLLITTPEDAESTMEVRVYDCRDLLAMPKAEGGSSALSQSESAPAAKSPGGEASIGTVQDPFGAPPSGFQSKGKSGGGFGGGTAGAAPATGRSTAQRPISDHQIKAEQLMDIAVNNVDPDTWNEVGGPGSIGEFNGLIVVTQTAYTHRKVERLFDMLREAAGLEVPKSGKVVR